MKKGGGNLHGQVSRLGLTSDQNNASVLLLTVWDSAQRIVRRLAITILIFTRRLPPTLIPTENFEWEHGGHCIYDAFYMHQVPLAYMEVFRQTSLEPGLCGPKLDVLPIGPPRPTNLHEKGTLHTLLKEILSSQKRKTTHNYERKDKDSIKIKRKIKQSKDTFVNFR